MPIMLLLLVDVSEAAAPSAIPANIIDYVQLNLSTSWSSVHSTYIQQMVNITESTYSNYLVYNNNFASFEYFYSNGTVIPSWIESNTSGKIITWVKIKNTTTSFYLGFASKSTNLLSSSCTSGIGEAPQLSSTYAEYDTGPCVFPYYQRWGGLSALPSSWSEVSGTVVTFASTYIEIAPASSTGGWYGIYLNPIPSSLSSTTTVWELYGNMYDSPDSAVYAGTVPVATLGNTYSYDFVEGASSPKNLITLGNAGSLTAASTGYNDTNVNKVYSMQMNSATSLSMLINYASIYSTTSATSETPTYFDFAVSNNGGGTPSNPQYIYWLRTRAYPPSGVMPIVSFGAVQSTIPTLTITPNPATYGQSITITATCTPSTDPCAIDYPNLTTTLASGTGTATYTYNAFSIAAGTYGSYYAVDKTSGLNSTAQTLTINKNSTTLTWLKQGKNSVYGLTQNTTAKINTHNNQLSANLYLNGNLIGSTNTIITNLQSALGTYSYTFNTTGNTNYTAASIKYNYTISAYKFLAAKVNTTAYETSTQGYDYEINVSSLVSNVILQENGVAIASLSPTGTLPSAQWFNFTYAIPLLAVNNTAVSFNAVIDVSNTLTTVNSTTQHLLQNYFTSGGPKYNPI
ncbi:MAG: hypothetical protein QXI42_12520, partial [Thermoproteota archaeon]